MAAWGLIVAVLLVLGSLPFFLGLAIVIPCSATQPPGISIARRSHQNSIRSRCRRAHRADAQALQADFRRTVPVAARGRRSNFRRNSEPLWRERRSMIIGRRAAVIRVTDGGPATRSTETSLVFGRFLPQTFQ